MASSSNIILAAFGLAVVAAIRPVVIAGGGIDPNGGAGRSRLSSRLGGGLLWNQRLVLLKTANSPATHQRIRRLPQAPRAVQRVPAWANWNT